MNIFSGYSPQMRTTIERGNLFHFLNNADSKPKRRRLEKLPLYPTPRGLIKILKHKFEKYPNITIEEEQWLSFHQYISGMKDIQEFHYEKIMHYLLYLDDYFQDVCQDQSRKEFHLKNRVIYRLRDGGQLTPALKSNSLDVDPTYSSDRFIIKLPVKDDSDKYLLLPNDIVEVRQAIFGLEHKLKVTAVGHNYIIVKADHRFLCTYKEVNRYHIKFNSGNWPTRVCHFAISLVIKNGLTPLIFPKKINAAYNFPRTLLRWTNKNIESNPEQMQAIQGILGRTAHPAPYILFGPPGTGKTATIVEAIIQIHNRNPFGDRILICTPSNAAADEITKRLMRIIPNPETMLYRMLSPSREGEGVDESIYQCAKTIRNGIDLSKRKEIGKMKIIITTLINCMRLVRMNLGGDYFSYIFIDEAGQATQPESLIPYGLLRGNGASQTQIVLSGDPMQLGPVIMTKYGQHLLGVSMLERYMTFFELYQKGYDGKYNPNYITKIVKNYRSHDAILRVPNKLFYGGELVTCGGQEIFRGENWPGLPNKKFPILFHAVDGLEKRDDESCSVCNDQETKIVVQYVRKLLGSMLGKSRIKKKDIGIVTPFKYQNTIILQELGKIGCEDISVGTVETFQGQEKDVIIISTVRSALYQHEGKFHIGFLSHKKRFNVTITRAKSLLIVVGNPKVLQIDDCWREFIQYCRRNGSCLGYHFILSDLSEEEKIILLNNRVDRTKRDDKLLKTKPISTNGYPFHSLNTGTESDSTLKTFLDKLVRLKI